MKTASIFWFFLNIERGLGTAIDIFDKAIASVKVGTE